MNLLPVDPPELEELCLVLDSDELRLVEAAYLEIEVPEA
jgi:hypothetical protein